MAEITVTEGVYYLYTDSLRSTANQSDFSHRQAADSARTVGQNSATRASKRQQKVGPQTLTGPTLALTGVSGPLSLIANQS